ncbi:unnamed protein product [Paramecium octaurelia]|uniref:Uncharacterized protein n=1 Tax=Paramecium octaurelia TaxID=43137 RepID=A0A8S1U3P7_PAROT|nr:unnamed protein product [Paramecium octaurelia]
MGSSCSHCNCEKKNMEKDVQSFQIEECITIPTCQSNLEKVQMVKHKKAIIIQKYWRGYLIRRTIKQETATMQSVSKTIPSSLTIDIDSLECVHRPPYKWSCLYRLMERQFPRWIWRLSLA